MAYNNNLTYQHQPLRTPAGWVGQDKALVVQLDELFDDVYRRIGKIEKTETTEIRGTNGAVIGYATRMGNMVMIQMQGVNDSFPSGGIKLLSKYTAAKDTFSCCRYASGNTSAIGLLAIEMSTSKLKLLDISGSGTAGTSVAGELIYIVRET